jgi:TonB family protein
MDCFAGPVLGAARAYLGKVEIRIMAAWKIPPKSKGLKVALRYHLARNGAVSFVRVEKSSCNESFDSAVQALRRASPFPPGKIVQFSRISLVPQFGCPYFSLTRIAWGGVFYVSLYQV